MHTPPLPPTCTGPPWSLSPSSSSLLSLLWPYTKHAAIQRSPPSWSQPTSCCCSSSYPLTCLKAHLRQILQEMERRRQWFGCWSHGSEFTVLQKPVADRIRAATPSESVKRACSSYGKYLRSWMGMMYRHRHSYLTGALLSVQALKLMKRVKQNPSEIWLPVDYSLYRNGKDGEICVSWVMFTSSGEMTSVKGCSSFRYLRKKMFSVRLCS